MDTTQEQQDISKVPAQLQPHVYKKGQSGNPGGRPKGSISMKQYVQNKLLSMTEEERETFLEGIDKKTIWEMSEGKAKQDTDVLFKEPIVIQWGNASNNTVPTPTSNDVIPQQQSEMESSSDPQTVW